MDSVDPALRGAVRRRPRRVDRQRRPAQHRQGAPLLRAEPSMGRQRVCDRVRRLPAARRPRRRPARPSPGLHRWPHGRGCRFAGRRIRRQPGPVDRRARSSGPGRRDHLAVRPVDRHHPVQGWGRAQQGPWRVGRRRGLRGGRRRAPRRHPHRRPRMGMGALGERPGVASRAGPDARPDSREPLRVDHASL